MAKWLDKYEQGGLVLKQKTKDNYGKKPNPNDVTVSSGPNYVGMGNDITGRDYSPAWGGQFQSGGFLQPTSPKLPKGYVIPYNTPSTELAMSIGGEDGEPAYLIPSFKGGKKLKDPIAEYKKTGEHLGGPFKTWQEAEKFGEMRHKYVEKGQDIPTPLKTWGDMQSGGRLPIITSDPKDPRFQAYRDSLELYNRSMYNHKQLIRPDFSLSLNGGEDNPGVTYLPISKNNSDSHWANNYKRTFKSDEKDRWLAYAEDRALLSKTPEPELKALKLKSTYDISKRSKIRPVQNVEYNYGEGPYGGIYETNMLFKKPVQPVEYKKLEETKTEETKPTPYIPKGSKKYILNGMEVSEEDFLGSGPTTGGSKRIIYSTPKLGTQKVLRLDGTPETDPEKIRRALATANKDNMAMGGSLPGAVGFTYARVAGSAPANGKYTKKTKASAQNGKEMKFYQDGLDFKPNSIAQDGKKLTKAGCPPGHVNIDGRCIDTQSVAYDKLRNYGIGYFDKDNVFNTSTSDLPEVVVKSKSASDFINSAVQSFSDRTTDESGNSVYTPVTPGQKYAFDQIGKQYGFPEVKSQEKYVDENPYSFYSFGHGHYADNTVYADNLTTYLKELPHHLQRKTLKKDWILNDLPAYIKGEDPYNVKGTTEYAAHSIIEPNIRDQFDEYENEYNKRFVRKDISPKEILKKWGIPAKKKQDGGAIVDPMGQWAHPGEVTIIPATDITMEGVDYPVLGISDTGDQQMMYPGEDYNFDGEYVTEYPMMKNGGWLNKYQDGGGLSRSNLEMMSTLQKDIKNQKAKNAQETISQYTPAVGDKERMNAAKDAYRSEEAKPLNRFVSNSHAVAASNNLPGAVEFALDVMTAGEAAAALNTIAKPALKAAGKYLTEKTALKNASIINNDVAGNIDNIINKWWRRETAPGTKHEDAINVLSEFKQRIKTPEGQKRLKELGISNDEFLQKLKIIEDNTSSGYYNNGKIGLHKYVPNAGTVTRHEIEHGVQGALGRDALMAAKKGTVDDKMAALSVGPTKIDDILSKLELRKTPNKIVRGPENLNDIYLDPYEFNRRMSDKQAATDYFTYGSEGREKSAFAAEAQQYMLDKGIIKHPYENITPDKVRHAMVEAQFDKETYPIRLFHIMKNTDNNYKTVSDALNKMLTVSPILAGGTATLTGSKEKKNGGWLNKYK